VNLNVPDNVV